MSYLKFVAPIGIFFGLMPLVKVFTSKELKSGLIETGFEIDYHWHWQPDKGKPVFIVAKKAA